MGKVLLLNMAGDTSAATVESRQPGGGEKIDTVRLNVDISSNFLSF